MYKALLIIVLLFSSVQVFGQDKVVWDFSFNKETSTMEAKAVLEEGWHLYSQYVDDEVGPIPTEFGYSENPDLVLIGRTIEPEPVKEYDVNFEGELTFFKDEVIFTQQLKVLNATTVEGVVTYMVCNDYMCYPPVDKNFTITVEN
jgi:Thiol:disulfide interchange protein DsbD, N-terminal